MAHPYHHYTITNLRTLLSVIIPSLPTLATVPHPCLFLPLFGMAHLDQGATEGEIFTKTESACDIILLLPPITVAFLLQATLTTISTIPFPLRITTIALLPMVAIEMTRGFIPRTDVGGSICRLSLRQVTATTAAALHQLFIPPPWDPLQ